MTEHKLLSPCPFCGEKLFLDIDESGGVAILHSLKEKDCFFPSILEIEMPVGTTLDQMIEKINRRPIQESFEHAIVRTSLVSAARLQDKDFVIQDLKDKLKNITAELAEARADAERLAKTFVIEVYPHEWACRGCHHMGKTPDTINHAPDCQITLHKELVAKYGGSNE